MDLKTAIKQISDQIGKPKTRAAFGQWTPLAWVVRGLVEQGHPISDAVRSVLENSGHKNDRKNFGSLRAAYYSVKDKEWPATPAEGEEDEGFE